ncbi:MAG: ABC transporter ATP-binding protein [Deltaproteobacteria bacterium]|nr:ABC transporter ATP-binding protein [Deltaproteobacteria bacterium]
MQLLNELKELKKLWPYVRDQRGILILSIFLIPLISVVQLFQPIVLKYAIDDGVMINDITALVYFSGIFLGLILLEYVFRGVQAIGSALVVQRMIRSLRGALSRHLLRQSQHFHHRHLSGVLVTRTTSEFDALSDSLTQGTLQSLVDIVVLLGCIVGMIVLHPFLGVLASLSLPLVLVIVAWFSKKIKHSYLEARKNLAFLNAFTQESLQGVATIKLTGSQGAILRKHKDLSARFRDAQMVSVVFDSFLFSVLDGIASVTIGMILWLIFMRFGADPTLTAGVVVAFVRYVQQIFDPLKQLGQTISTLQGVFTSMDRIFKLMDHSEVIGGERKLANIAGHVEFSDVNFTYPMRKRAANSADFSLEGINFELKPGESLALVGPTGAGKSTVVKLLTKQYEGYRGHIYIDGRELADLEPFELRKRIAIVPQDIVLFNGTVAFNISLDHPELDREGIVAAANLVGIHEFVTSLPGQYEEWVREDGSNLSLGQRQLIVFARALARNPDLVVLDEATSALDPESERLVQKAIDNIFSRKSVIVIAHRLSTIEHCKKILRFERGKAELVKNFNI